MNKYIVIFSGVLLYGISAYFAYSFFSSDVSLKIINPIANTEYKAPSEANQAATEFTGPKTEECPTNGEMLTAQQKKLWETRRPLGVMIENSVDSRPQSGIGSADVVYEAVAEGGITRFLNIFYCKDAPYVGPVRSARVYFLSLVQGYGDHPLYAHVGGANTPGPANALGQISDMGWAGYNDMNQFSISFPTFYRDYNRLPGVVTEHTMYSSTQKLWKYAADKRGLTELDKDGVTWDKTFVPWKFKEDGKKATGTPALVISYPFWAGRAAYDAKWTYNEKTNTYVRSHGDGKSHVDKNDGKQLEAHNVVAIFSDESKANDGYPGTHLIYKVIGNGTGKLFQDGVGQDIVWRRTEKTSLLHFYDKAGKEIELNRGKTWVSILPTGNTVTVAATTAAAVQ
ncbi:MAG: DUF3048 domain-containing protein [Candidatus Roizmanbacteria bacterium]